jgi:predicted hydrocarbon binding protein
MNFLGALASGIEHAIGESANGISYLAGKRLGMQFSQGASTTDDIVDALGTIRDVLVKFNCLWHFEPFKPHGRETLVISSGDSDEILIVYRDCMIRQSLFSFGHAQKGSLCNMMNGFFAGAIKNIMGCDSSLEILHAGENGCLKKLTVNRNSRGDYHLEKEGAL